MRTTRRWGPTPTLPLVAVLSLLAVSCGTGPSEMPAAVGYHESGWFESRTLTIDAAGQFVYDRCVGDFAQNCRRLEGRLEAGEQASLQAAVGSRSFRRLSGTYPADPGNVCIPEESFDTIRVTRGGEAQEVTASGCARPPAAFTEALAAIRGIVVRIDP